MLLKTQNFQLFREGLEERFKRLNLDNITEYYLKRTEEASFSSKETTKKTILFKIKLVKDF